MNRTKSVRGQAAVEFLAYIGIFLLVMAVSILIFTNQQGAELGQKEYLLADTVAKQFSDQVSFSLRAGNGFKGTFFYPTKILGKEYSVEFRPGDSADLSKGGYVYLDWNGTESTPHAYQYPINTKDFRACNPADPNTVPPLGPCPTSPNAVTEVSEGGQTVAIKLDVNPGEAQGNYTIFNQNGTLYIYQGT